MFENYAALMKATDGLTLGQVCAITGLEASTIQNWVKRGWIGNTVNKRYSKDQLARILIINMMRSSMMLEKIDYILHYINGNIEDKSDDIISEAELYGYICDIYDEFTDSGLHKVEDLRVIIDKITKERYVEPFEGAKTRLDKALEIILVAYFASNAAAFANILFNAL
jgi:DNA-binding transcriptional MerR regulator